METGNRLKILIADDEASLRLLVRNTLENPDLYELFTASDGEEALALIRSLSPDVVILDLMMPRLSGLEVLADLNKNTLPNRPRIIVLSARVNEERRARALGADLFLCKPFSPLQLIGVVEKALGQSAA